MASGSIPYADIIRRYNKFEIRPPQNRLYTVASTPQYWSRTFDDLKSRPYLIQNDVKAFTQLLGVEPTNDHWGSKLVEFTHHQERMEPYLQFVRHSGIREVEKDQDLVLTTMFEVQKMLDRGGKLEYQTIPPTIRTAAMVKINKSIYPNPFFFGDPSCYDIRCGRQQSWTHIYPECICNAIWVIPLELMYVYNDRAHGDAFEAENLIVSGCFKIFYEVKSFVQLFLFIFVKPGQLCVHRKQKN